MHGCWLDATQDLDCINEEIQGMLSSSKIPGAEEYAIHDFEDFGSFHLGEYESIANVHELAIFIQEHGELGAELLQHFGGIESAQDVLDNNYHGAHDSELDFAMQLFDDCYLHDIPNSLQCYIDYDGFCRDLFISDYFSVEVNHEVHIFSNY